MSQRPTPPYTSDASARPVNLKDGDLKHAVPLPDFMQELGVLLRLPKRQATRPVVIIPETTVAPRRVNARAAALLVLAVAMLGGAGFSRLTPVPKPEPLPTELHGEWRTKNPKYRERILSFTEDRVGISMADGQAPSLHPVTALSSKMVSDTVVLSMTYQDDGAPVDFRVSLVKGAHPLLWLSNPPDVVWEPVGRASNATNATNATNTANAANATNPVTPVTSGTPANAASAPSTVTKYAPGEKRPWEH